MNDEKTWLNAFPELVFCAWEVLKKAKSNPDQDYFLILDEESGAPSWYSINELIDRVNDDRNPEWEDYDADGIIEGIMEFDFGTLHLGFELWVAEADTASLALSRLKRGKYLTIGENIMQEQTAAWTGKDDERAI
jgi:hypothetical protein